MRDLRTPPFKCHAIWDKDKGEYLYGYKHSIEIALFMTVKGARIAIGHIIKWDPKFSKGTTYKTQTRYEIHEMKVSFVNKVEA